MTTGTSRFRIHTHWNQQTTSKRRKDKNRTYEQII